MTTALLKRLRQFAASRHNQRKAPFFVVEGLRCCREALTRRPDWLETALLSDDAADTPAGAEFEQLAKNAGLPPERVPANDFNALAMTEGPQGMLCVMRKPQPRPPTGLTPPAPSSSTRSGNPAMSEPSSAPHGLLG